MKVESPFLTTREVAEYYRVKPQMVIEWIREGLLPGAIDIGRKRPVYRIPKDSLNAVIKNISQSLPDGVEEIIKRT